MQRKKETMQNLEVLLRPSAPVRNRNGIYSVLPPEEEGATYDARAAAYDRIVGSALYNRLLWGFSVDRFDAFVQEALSSGDGPFLDAGCGSSVFTAEMYVEARRPLVLVDRSRGMLEAADVRLAEEADGHLPAHVTLLQGDLKTLPLRRNSVDTILSMGMLHLFEDVTGKVGRLLEWLVPGGTLFATSLVAERFIGRQYLLLLHAGGEVATPRTFDNLRRQLSAAFDCTMEARCEGSMAFLTIRT